MEAFIIAALTADGFIAKTEDQVSTFWTSKEDAQWYADKSTEAGVVVMGMSTYKTINRPLPDRVTIVYTRTPDAEKTLENQTSLEKNQVYHTQLEPEKLLKKIEELGFDQVAISGGSSIYTQFMVAGLVSKLYLTREPMIFGAGISLFNRPLDVNLKLVETHRLSPQTVVEEFEVL